MFEDSTMEKKNRSTQPSAKGSGTDSKKTPDAQNGKQFPRGFRKRELAGGSNSVKNEPRRPPPPKGKIFDKRPKPRGFYYGGPKEGLHSLPQINDEALEEEFGILFNGGKKKQSLNHLLNFHYEPRGVTTNERRHVETYSTKSLMSTHAHKYNKEQFLQANCQFVVRANEDYGCYLGDPDLLVDWSRVELIRVGSCETVTCPICLYPPTAAKITRCGHIYCWMCILHYLALSDKTWRKCPICYEAIHNKDLKSVECIERNSFTVGNTVTLQLMKRERNSLIASPVNEFNVRSDRPILDLSEKDLVTVYSKLLLAQRTDIDAIIQKDQSELEEQLKEFEGCPELCFVQQALENLNQRKVEIDHIFHKTDEPIKKQTPEPVIEIDHFKQNTQPEYDYFDEKPIVKERLDSDSSNDNSKGAVGRSQSESSEDNINVEDLLMKENAGPSKFFYFYQSIDGQEIYLHSINLRMLEKTYGTLENCPITIKGKIVQKEVGSMTAELRKRLKYLQHVPITCQFEVVELNLHPPLISPEVIHDFEEQLELRKKRRQKMAKAERKREKKITETMMKEMGISPKPDLRIESHYHFPGCGEADFPRAPAPNTSSAKSSRTSSPIRDRSPTSVAMAALSLEPEEGPSFAQMLREGNLIKTDENAWPSVGDANQTSGAWGQQNTTWGQPRRRQPSVRLEEEDDSCFSPPAKPSFNFAEAFEAAARVEKGNKEKKKKKKQKKIFGIGMETYKC